jgi:hypothetical protein
VQSDPDDASYPTEIYTTYIDNKNRQKSYSPKMYDGNRRSNQETRVNNRSEVSIGSKTNELIIRDREDSVEYLRAGTKMKHIAKDMSLLNSKMLSKENFVNVEEFNPDSIQIESKPRKPLPDIIYRNNPNTTFDVSRTEDKSGNTNEDSRINSMY